MKSVHILVRGVVQGVGFRWFTWRTANQLGLKGYVRNRFDDSVEIFAEGEEGVLRGFVEELKIGPRSAHVTEVEVNWEHYKGKYSEFRVEP